MDENREQEYQDQYGSINKQVEPSSFDNPISTKHWLLVLLVQLIPIANFIFLIIWAVGNGKTSEAKQGYARASLIFKAVSICLITLFYWLMFFLFFATVGLESF